MSGPPAMLSWHHDFHFRAHLSLHLPAKEKVSSRLLERDTQGERTFSALGLDTSLQTGTEEHPAQGALRVLQGAPALV